MPTRNLSTYIPRIYGFRVYQKKGSKFLEDNQDLIEVTHYSEEMLKNIKGKKTDDKKIAASGFWNFKNSW